MKPRITLAVIVSLVLVVGAVWYRFKTNILTSSGLVAVAGENEELSADNTDIQQYDTTTNTSEPALTKSEMLGRSLITDYINLASNSNANNQTINDLAMTYVNKIPSIITPKKISSGDIKSVPNTKDNFINYTNGLMEIEKDYSLKITVEHQKGGDYTNLGPDLYKLSGVISEAYGDAAIKLEALPTPLALVEASVRLINLYLSNSTSMRSISNTELDSSSAFAGIIIMKDNADQETTILKEINQILIKNSI